MNNVPLKIVSTASLKNTPIIPVGIVPISINQAKRFSALVSNPFLNLSRPSDRSTILRIKPFTMLMISFQKNVNIAINVPRCNIVSKASPVSTPNKCGINAR